MFTITRRRLSLAVLVALALAGLGYGAYWFHVAGELRKGIATWADQRRAAGWTVEFGDIKMDGFPLDIRARIPSPALATPDGALGHGALWHGALGHGALWRADGVTARASPFDLTRVTVSAPGRHELAWNGRIAMAEAARLDVTLDVDSAGRLERADLAAALSIDLPGLGPLGIRSIDARMERLNKEAIGHDQPSASFAARLDELLLPDIPGLVIERRIRLAEISGRVMGGPSPAPPADAIARWAAEGGSVEIERIVLEWEPLALEGEGTFALDPALQPLVALSARVRGYEGLMDRLSGAGVLDPANANLAKMLLTLMAKPDAQGRPAVPVPVTLQDGDLYLGPARVARVPPLDWPR